MTVSKGVKCHQRVIRETLIDPAPDVELIKPNAVVRVISKEEAAAVILKYEWLQSMPATTQTAVGLFFRVSCN